MSQIGQPDDPRRFVGKGGAEATKDSVTPKTKGDRCQICKMEITGKRWRVGEDKYVCTRCSHE